MEKERLQLLTNALTRLSLGAGQDAAGEHEGRLTVTNLLKCLSLRAHAAFMAHSTSSTDLADEVYRAAATPLFVAANTHLHSLLYAKSGNGSLGMRLIVYNRFARLFRGRLVEMCRVAPPTALGTKMFIESLIAFVSPKRPRKRDIECLQDKDTLTIKDFDDFFDSDIDAERFMKNTLFK